MKIGSVSCGKGKLDGRHAARDLYTSTLFKESLRLAEARCDLVYVLSDKHGVIPLDQEVEAYELDIKSFSKEQLADWGRRVRGQLALKPPVEIYILAGQLYLEGLGLKRVPGVTVISPLDGKQLGKRVQWLQAQNATPSAPPR